MSDMISRQDALSFLRNWERVKDYSWGERNIIKATINEIESLPSAQPDVPDTNVGDLISREAMGDALNRIRVSKNETFYSFYQKALDELCKLPSAQPETAKRIVGKSRGGMTLWYQCDMCNEPVDAQDNFCRGCGRRLTDG